MLKCRRNAQHNPVVSVNMLKVIQRPLELWLFVVRPKMCALAVLNQDL